MNSRIPTLVLLLATAALGVAADAPTTFTVSDVKFTRPAAWEWVPTTSEMRKAQLKVPGKEGKAAAEIVFFHFGAGGGGGTEANVNRWFSQFQEPREQISAKTDSAMVEGVKVTYVQAQGTYRSGMPGGPSTPMPNYALVGAIVEAAGGSVFVRMTGPKETALPAIEEFKKMIESGLKK